MKFSFFKFAVSHTPLNMHFSCRSLNVVVRCKLSGCFLKAVWFYERITSSVVGGCCVGQPITKIKLISHHIIMKTVR